MPILKKGSKNNFTIINNNCFFDKSLSWQEIGMLCNMISLPDDWKFTVRGLAALHTNGVDSTCNILNSLIDKGYVYREQPLPSKETNGKYGEIIYWIYNDPLENPNYKGNIQRTGNPDTDFQCPENQYTENQYTDYTDQLNTNKLNTKNINNIYDLDTDTAQYNTYNIRTNELERTDTEPLNEQYDPINSYEDYVIKQLSNEQYKAYTILLEDVIEGRLDSTKGNLLRYFEKMMNNRWKRDSDNQPIFNIVGHVRSNFTASSKDRKIADKALREEGLDPYDYSYRKN